MTILPILSMLLIGTALGRRFKVLVLIPAIGLGFAAILLGAIVRGDSASTIVITAVLASSSLQIGYLCGMLTRYSSARARNPLKAGRQAESARWRSLSI